MDLQMILFIALIIIFFIIPLLVFIIKSAVKQGILEAYKIIKNDKAIIINVETVLLNLFVLFNFFQLLNIIKYWIWNSFLLLN